MAAWAGRGDDEMHGQCSTMPFGKHRGEPISDLPSDYLFWLASLPDLRRPLKYAIEAEVNRRLHQAPVVEALPVDGDLAIALVEAGRRALALKLHPDRGGDTALMARVNDTADKLLSYYGQGRRRAA